MSMPKTDQFQTSSRYNTFCHLISCRVFPHTTPPRCSASTPMQTSPTRANSLKMSWTPSWASNRRTAPAGVERPEKPSWVDWQMTCWRNCLQILYHSRWNSTQHNSRGLWRGQSQWEQITFAVWGPEGRVSELTNGGEVTDPQH